MGLFPPADRPFLLERCETAEIPEELPVPASDLIHPFAAADPRTRKQLFFLLLVLTAAALFAQQGINAGLKTAAAPSGIVSFELAGRLPAAREILASWEGRREILAGLSLGTDYLFLVSYALFLALACGMAAEGWARRKRLPAVLGAGLAWGQLLAGMLDATENFALIRILLGSANPVWPVLAKSCAVPKFVLVGLGIVYLSASGVAFGIRRPVAGKSVNR